MDISFIIRLQKIVPSVLLTDSLSLAGYDEASCQVGEARVARIEGYLGQGTKDFSPIIFEELTVTLWEILQQRRKPSHGQISHSEKLWNR